MKNFYDAITTRSDLKLKVILELESVGVCPCQLKINNQLEFYGDLVGKNMFIKHLNLTEPINIQITLNREHPQAIKINKLTVDGFEILPIYQQFANPPTNYLDFTGIWTFQINNFYSWYHEVTGQGWII